VFNFVDVPKPKAWPPPQERSKAEQELLAYSYKRDPAGDKVHTWLACLCMFFLPLATAPASISMALLFGYSLLRLPTTWRTITPLLRSKMYISVLAWAMYSTLSIIWSEDSTQGFDHARTMWLMAVPLPVLLWPVFRKWKWFVFAGFAGVALQNIVQCSEVISSWFLDGNDWLTGNKLERPSGFTKHQGTTAIYIASAVLAYLALSLKSAIRKPILIFFCLALFSVVVVQSRATWVGLLLATIILIVIILYAKETTLSKLFAFSGVSLVVIVLAVCSIGYSLTQRVSRISSVTNTVSQTATLTSTQYRMHWWIETTQFATKGLTIPQRLFGRGLGSTARIDYSTTNKDFPKHAVHPHNMFVQTLYEGGIVGLAATCIMLASIAWACVVIRKPLLLSLLVLWATVAFFDGSQNSGRSLAFLMLIVFFTHSCIKVDTDV
jgi:O-antigen ligase